MIKTYNFNYRGEHLTSILHLCSNASEFYNLALDTELESYNSNKKWVSYQSMDVLMKQKRDANGIDLYHSIPVVCAQQILRQLNTDVFSYSKALKSYYKNKKKFRGAPKPPKHKDKPIKIGFTCSQSGSHRLKNGVLTLKRGIKIFIPQWNKYKNVLSSSKSFEVIPHLGYVTVSIRYEIPDIETKETNREASIDLGVNNIITLFTIDGDALIFNGGQIKFEIQGACKKAADLQTVLKKENGRDKSNQITQIYDLRNNSIDDMFHKVACFIVDYLNQKDIDTLIIGRNKGWKNEISIGKKNNQMFSSIPFYKLIKMFEYKCKQKGIKLILREESYTSKCDSLALEEICKHQSYLGSRDKRGKFKSSTGIEINADVNAAINIMRKEIGDEKLKPVIEDIKNNKNSKALNPIKFNDLRSLPSKFNK